MDDRALLEAAARIWRRVAVMATIALSPFVAAWLVFRIVRAAAAMGGEAS